MTECSVRSDVLYNVSLSNHNSVWIYSYLNKHYWYHEAYKVMPSHWHNDVTQQTKVIQWYHTFILVNLFPVWLLGDSSLTSCQLLIDNCGWSDVISWTFSPSNTFIMWPWRKSYILANIIDYDVTMSRMIYGSDDKVDSIVTFTRTDQGRTLNCFCRRGSFVTVKSEFPEWSLLSIIIIVIFSSEIHLSEDDEPPNKRL